MKDWKGYRERNTKMREGEGDRTEKMNGERKREKERICRRGINENQYEKLKGIQGKKYKDEQEREGNRKNIEREGERERAREKQRETGEVFFEERLIQQQKMTGIKSDKRREREQAQLLIQDLILATFSL